MSSKEAFHSRGVQVPYHTNSNAEKPRHWPCSPAVSGSTLDNAFSTDRSWMAPMGQAYMLPYDEIDQAASSQLHDPAPSFLTPFESARAARPSTYHPWGPYTTQEFPPDPGAYDFRHCTSPIRLDDSGWENSQSMSLADPYRHEIMCDDFTTGAQRINGNIPGMSMSEAASKDEDFTMVASDLLRQNSHESRSIHDVETPRSENAISAFSIPRVARGQSRILSEAPPPNLAGRKYECNAPSCSKSFGRLSELKKHSRVHQDRNSRPYPCSECSGNERFMSPKDLRRHKSSVHYADVVRHHCIFPSCELSSKGLTRKDKMQRHLRDVHKIGNPKDVHIPITDLTKQVDNHDSIGMNYWDPDESLALAHGWIDTDTGSLYSASTDSAGAFPNSTANSRSPTPSFARHMQSSDQIFDNRAFECSVCDDFHRASSRFLRHSCHLSKDDNRLRELLSSLSPLKHTHSDWNG